MSPVQLAAPLPETDIYGDPIKETEVTEQAHLPEPLPTPPPIDTRPSSFAMLQHQPCQHHAHPITPCSHNKPVQAFVPRTSSLEFTPTPPLPIDPEKILRWMENAMLLQELNNETKGKDSHTYLNLYTDIHTLANRMNQINNEILDVKDTLKNTKEEVERLEKHLKVVSAHKQVLLTKASSCFRSFRTSSPSNSFAVMPHSSFRTAPPLLTLTPLITNFSTKLPHSSPPHNKVSSTALPCVSLEMDELAGTKTKDVSTLLTARVKNTGTHNATCANCMDTFNGIVPNTTASTVAPIVERSPDNARTKRSPSPSSPPAYRRSLNDKTHPHTTFQLLITEYSQIIPSPSSTLNGNMPNSLQMNNSTTKLTPFLSWNCPMPIRHTWMFCMENSLTMNTLVISMIWRPSFATLMMITSILMLNIVIPNIGWISEEAIHAFFLLCLFLFALYVFFFFLFCHKLVVRVLRKRIMLCFLLFVPVLLYAVLDYYVFKPKLGSTCDQLHVSRTDRAKLDQHNWRNMSLPKPEGRVMPHDDNIEHTRLVVETQAILSNDASRPRGIIGTIC